VAQDGIEEGLALNLESTDLVTLVRQSIEALAPLHEGSITFEPAVSRLIGEWDSRRLSRICENLVSNAVKYSARGAPVRVSVEGATRDVPGALLRVADEGIGIPADDLAHIFEPFHRAANSAAIAGTGIGLAGTKAGVEAHGGTISAASEMGQGTTFSVWLPLHPHKPR
jgi:signal transduction histidine kinase